MFAQIDGTGKPIKLGQLYGYHVQGGWRESIVGRAVRVTPTGLISIVAEQIHYFNGKGEFIGQGEIDKNAGTHASIIPFKLFPIADPKANLIQSILTVCHEVNDKRDSNEVFKTIAEEFGELATELAILSGHKNRTPGPDGVFGESVDMLIAVVDMIHLANQAFSGLTDEALVQAINQHAGLKLAKWKKAKCK